MIFGATGDLTRRKLLPAFYHLFMERRLPDRFAIVGAGRTEMTDDGFRSHARESVANFAHCAVEPGVWTAFARRLSYVMTDADADRALGALALRISEIDRDLGIDGRVLFYLATPPAGYPGIVEGLINSGLNKSAKVVIEKPFGWDLRSAQELNAELHRAFDEGQMPQAEPGSAIKSNKFVVPPGAVFVSKLNPSICRVWLPIPGRRRPICCSALWEFCCSAAPTA